MTKRNLRDAQAEVSQLEMELQRKDKLLRGLQERKRRMDAKVQLVPYNKLMPFIKSIPVGSMYSVYETLCEGLDEEYKVHGCYRNLAELLIKLAEFYLSGCSGHTLVWFEEEYKFYVSLGGDGAPFGKHDTACAWLVGFLNIGRRILSSNENFLLFGANCSENCIPVQRYIKMLVSDVQHLEQQTFKCTYITSESQTCTVDIKFHISEFPNDLKMVAFLCGELTNSATYFCSFANVSSKDATEISGQFGKEKDKKWHPWNYSERKVLSDPKIHIDPLHLKNNACALAHRLLLQEVLLIFQLPSAIKSFLQVPSTSSFHKYIDAMRTKCNVRRLANKIIRWFNENRDSKFDYRYTGKDSRCFLQNFMFLIAAMEPFLKDKTKALFTFHVLAYLCLTLRDCVSVFSRIDVTDSQLDDLEKNCRTYFVLHYLYFDHHPTACTLGNIVSEHARDMKVKYGKRLGLNSMEGRESKHISISRYSKNTYFKARWEQIFQHEYVSLVWLGEKGYNFEKPASECCSRYMYIPKRATEDSKFCNCGCEKQVQSASC
ncbi:Hypothetical predicted protein, partial [Paramuricea clavata]